MVAQPMRDLLDRIARLSPSQRALLEQRLQQSPRKPLAPVEKIQRSDHQVTDCPLTHVQRRVWAFEQLYPGTSTYNVVWTTRLAGPLDSDAMERAVQAVFHRHIALRATFHQTPDGPVQRFSEADRVEYRILRVEDRFPDRRARAEELLNGEDARVFDLTAGPLARVVLMGLENEEHWLALIVHHLVTDGWSLEIVNRDLAEFYNAAVEGRETKHRPVSVDYRDFAVWLASRAKPDTRSASYWVDEVSDAPLLLELPPDHARNGVPAWKAWTEPVPVPPALLAHLERLCRDRDVTLYVLLVAAWAMLLQRSGGGDEIMIGSPLAGRIRPELEDAVGFFANTLPLRIGLAGNPSLAGFLRRVQEKVWGAVEHQDAAFDEAVEKAELLRLPGITPVFQTAVAYLELLPPPAFSGLRASRLPFTSLSVHFDSMLTVNQSAGAIEICILLRRSLFGASTCRRMAGHFLRLLEALAAGGPDQRIGQFSLMTPGEREAVLALGTRTDRPFPREPVHVLFEDQARRTPDRVALCEQDRTITYGALSNESNRIAAALAREGIGAEAVVAVLCDGSAAMVAAFLGVLKAGAAYLPLDADEPRERMEFLLGEAGAAVVLDAGRGDASLRFSAVRSLAIGAMPPAPAPAVPVSCDDAAYVMFTSGSTGKPKAVVVPHRGIVRLVKDAGYARMGPGDVFLQLAPASFDASTFEIWAPLLNGGRCVLYAGGRAALGEIGAVIKRQGVTTLWLTSSLFNAVIDEAPAILQPLDQLLIGGEALSVRHVAKAMAALPRTQIVNGYGPTECTTFACCYVVPRDLDPSQASIPIGHPIGNTQAYILDGQLEPVPPGVAGELFLGGDGVALGYLDNPELTARVFLPDPFRPGEGRRLYRTGDRARWLPDGRGIEYLGRLDDQVKIRGFRVEPGEVEAALARLPAVAQAAVGVQSDPSGAKRLIGYIVPASGSGAGAADLKLGLAAWLPEYMIPEQYVVVDRLPLRPNGKVDHDALPAPRPEPGGGSASLAPRDDLERELLAMWRELLGAPEAGIADDFFELGGHSLLALRLIARVETQFKHSLPVASIFAAPTVESFARILRKEGEEPGFTVITPGSSRRPTLFWIDPGAALGKLAGRLGADQPFCSVTLTAEDLAALPQPPRLEEIAERLAEKIERRNPGGPSLVASFCLRTLMAVEAARALRSRGHSVPLLILVDPSDPDQLDDIVHPGSPRQLLIRASLHLRKLRRLRPQELGPFLRDRGRALWKRLGMQFWPHRAGFRNAAMERPMLAAAALHRLQPFHVPVMVARCLEPGLLDGDAATRSWTRLALGGISVRSIPGGHVQMFDEPHVTAFAQVLREEIDRAVGSGSSGAW